MAEYIPKSALVAEIEKRISEYKNCGIDNTAINAKIIALENLLIYINTLETKEVSLEEELPVSKSLTEEGVLTFKDGSQAIIKKIG